MKRYLNLAAAGLALSIVAATGSASIAAERGGTMTFARYDGSTLIDPIYADRNPDIWMVTNLYDTLLRTESDGKTIVPGLASEFTVSDDGMTMTLTMRDGVKFSDGSPITAEDAKFSLERASNADLGPWASLLESVASVDADGNQVVINLSKPDPTLVSILATFNTAISPKAAFMASEGATDQEKAAAFFANGPVGSGPFVMTEFEQGSSMNFVRNEHYWRKGEDGQQLPYLDGVNFIIMPDDATRILKLQAGEIDGAEFIPFSRVAELNGDNAINMELFPSTRIIYMPINTRETLNDGSANPLSDVRIRQALNYATNKEILLQLVTHGAGSPATSLMASTTQLHHGPSPLYPYDVEKAKALMAEAGVDEVEITLTTLAGSSDDGTLFTALQQMWGAIGVKLTVEQVDGATRGAKNRSGDFDIHTYGWVNDVNDPAQITAWLGYYPQRKAVGTGWNNSEFNAIFEASNSEIDPDKRAEQYRQLQTIYADEAPLIFLYETPFAVAISSRIQGYLQTPLGNNEFASAYIAE